MTFIFDENLPVNLSKGIDLLEGGNFKTPYKSTVLHSTSDEVMGKSGDSDEDLIVRIGELNGILVTQDKDFKNKKHYFTLYRQHNVGVVLYTIQNKDIYWEKVKSFIKHWEDLKIQISGVERPFAFIIGKNGGIQKYDF